MVGEVPEKFASVGVVLVLVADLLTGHLRRYGDPVAARWLVVQLFGTPSKTRDTAAACQDQIMPRIWQQGQDRCFLIIPGNDILVGLVVADFDGDVHATHRLGMHLGEAAREVDWSAMAPRR
jgi:hypothetical protein